MLSAWCVALAFHAAALPGGSLYELARVEEARARYADAIGLYQACAGADPALAPYAQVRAAVCRTIAGDLRGGATELADLIEAPGDGPWKALAAHELARVYADNGHADWAAPLFGRALHSETDVWWMEDAYWEAAENALTVPGQEAFGYIFFRKTAQTSIWSKKRFEAAQKLATAPAIEERLGGILFLVNAGAAAEAEPQLKAIAPLMGDNPHLVYLRDRAQARVDIALGRTRTGVEALWRIGRDPESGDVGLDALDDLVNQCARQSDFVQAEQALAAIASRGAPDTRVRTARRTLAAAYAREDRPDDAAEHYSLVAAPPAGRDEAAAALLAAGNAYRKLGRAREATAYFDQVAERYAKTEQGVEGAYWSALLMDQAGVSKSEVRRRLRSAATHGITYYYGHRAVEMLANLGDDEAQQTLRIRITPQENVVRPIPMEYDTPASALDTLRGDDRFARMEFFALRGYPEAEWEALALGNSLKDSVAPDQMYLAMGEAGATAYTAMQFANAYGFGQHEDGSQTLTRLRVRYPQAYWGLVTNLSKEVGVDPYLILSVARQESTYRPALTSSAGAKGVMQVMPSTAKWLVDNDPRLTPELHADLTNPAHSLRLGAFYLRQMLDRYDGNVIYALAAYNGGPGNCDKWRRNFRGTSQADFVEAIAFTETRNYVKRVLSNYMTYHSIYPPAN